MNFKQHFTSKISFKNPFKPPFRIAIALLTCSAVLTGCGINTGNNGSPSKTPSAHSVKSTSEITFSWWGNDIRHEYTMNGVDIFMSKYPDINITNKYSVWQGFEKRTKVAMESHTEADVMQINYAWLSQYSSDGMGYYDLNELKDYIDLSTFTEDDLQYGIVDGHLNALPIAFNSNEFFYNKSIWDKYGLELPTKWEDFVNAAVVMQKDDIYPLGMVKKQAFMMLFAHYEQTHGKPVFDENGKLNIDTDGIADILKYYRMLVDKKVIMPIDDFGRTKFADGSVASCICWVSDAGNYCSALEASGGEPVIGGLIISPDAKASGWYIKPATMYAISAYTEHPEEAAKLLNFLVNSSEMASLQLTEKGVPVSTSALNTVMNSETGITSYEYEASQYMKNNMELYKVIVPIMENEDILNAFKQFGDDYIYDVSPLEECAQSIADFIKAY